ncbi:dsRBD fold-containing protein [Streptomyces sp. NPDC056255]|uniref:dsRBD fold-containing protein n=1 Tax=Streptomyces sp. NPDC056255 TaxID=3345764 RepID=UPI0035D6A07F
MARHTSTEKPHSKQWSVRLDIFEEGDLTKVHAVLDTGDTTLQSRTSAQRNPHDTPVPEIGDEFAVGRALVGLGNQLLRAGRIDSASGDSAAPG